MLQKEEWRETLTQNSVLPKKCCRISPYLATTSSFSSSSFWLSLLPLLTITSVTPCFPGNMHYEKKKRKREKSQITAFSKGIICSYFKFAAIYILVRDRYLCATVKDCLCWHKVCDKVLITAGSSARAWWNCSEQILQSSLVDFCFISPLLKIRFCIKDNGKWFPAFQELLSLVEWF